MPEAPSIPAMSESVTTGIDDIGRQTPPKLTLSDSGIAKAGGEVPQ